MEAGPGRRPGDPQATLLEQLLGEGTHTLIDEVGLIEAEAVGGREDWVSAAVELMREAPGAFRLRYEPEPLPLGQLSIVLEDRARAAALLAVRRGGTEPESGRRTPG